MLRQASSRNQRGKIGLKMKNVVQIGLLIAVCIWLFYQMNHSHNKKETFKGTSAKGGGRLFDVRVFGRKEKGDEEAKNGATKEGHGSGSNEELEEDDDDGDEAVHKAREISFNDDDASSEVAHTVQEASQPSGERSFKADDAASSAGAHAIQPNEPESESQNGALMKNLDGNEPDDKKKKHGEIRDVAEGYQMDELKNSNRNESGVTKEENSSISHQGSSTADNDTISTILGTPIPEITTTSFQNRTTVESKNEDQPFFQANSTYFSKHKIYFQKNSSTVSVELVASPANLTMKLESSNQTPVVHEEMNTTKMQTQREEKPNSENKLMEAGNSLTTQEKKRDVNGGDQSKNSDIQKRADSSSQQEEAVEK